MWYLIVIFSSEFGNCEKSMTIWPVLYDAYAISYTCIYIFTYKYINRLCHLHHPLCRDIRSPFPVPFFCFNSSYSQIILFCSTNSCSNSSSSSSNCISRVSNSRINFSFSISIIISKSSSSTLALAASGIVAVDEKQQQQQ